MNKKINQLEKIGNKNPFRAPEGYFEGLTGRIMSQLPERVDDTPKTISLWERVQPWFYMAAMFAGIALMVNLFARSSQQTDSGLNLTSSADIEDFYRYYEEQSVVDLYRDAVYLDVE